MQCYIKSEAVNSNVKTLYYFDIDNKISFYEFYDVDEINFAITYFEYRLGKLKKICQLLISI